MSSQDYFQIYIEIISEAFRRIRKVGFKKFGLVKDLLDTVENFLSKQVYGRIEPSNYLLALILLLGSRTPKLYSPIISAIQRLFSYNFISPAQDLWGSLKLLKEEHRQFLLLPIEDYSSRSFKQIYIETLINLGQKDEALNLSVAKSLSLIWRLDQNSLPMVLIPKVFDYLLDCLSLIRLQEQQKTLKSVFLQMFRHALQSYRQAHDRRFLHNDNCISLKGVVHKYGQILADQVVIQLDIEERCNISKYPIIPPEGGLVGFRVIRSKEVSEKGLAAGKFGWCTNCRQPADYYCNSHRLPVCSYDCKLAVANQMQSLEKFMAEEDRSLLVFQEHIVGLFKQFQRYLLLGQGKKRLSFAEILILMTSELKKVVDKLTPRTYTQLRGVVRHVIINVYCESEAFLPCMAILKKMLQLRIFIDETEILLSIFTRKLTYFLTAPHIRDEILKFIKDLINNRFIFDAVMALDLSADRQDSVRLLVDAIKSLYIGITLPEAINIPPPEDTNARKLSLEAALMLLKYLQETQKKMPRNKAEPFILQKKRLNRIRSNLQRFNTAEKPTKVIKKLVSEKALPQDPQDIASFMREHLKILNLTNVGQLIGDYDQLAGSIRLHFIGQIDLKGLPLDEAMRVMLKQFTLPGQSQVVERIIETFGITYFQQNREDTAFVNSDAVYAFSYLLMMLQSNLHNPQVVDKMTLPQFAKLSKGMNGSPDAEFSETFLQSIYSSVQRKPLGVHEKLKEIQLTIAFNASPKRALQIYLKDLQKQALEALQAVQQTEIVEIQHCHAYPLPVLVEQLIPQVVQMLCFKVRELDDKNQRQKEDIVRCLETTESALKLAAEWGVSGVIERGIKGIWDQVQRSNANKKMLLMQAMLQWVRKFSDHVGEQWRTVIFLIGKFNRSKLIRKDQGARKHTAIALHDNRVCLYDSYVEHLVQKTQKLSLQHLLHFLRALLAASREQANDNGSPFCLEKINDVLELNAHRNPQILAIFWQQLRDYYIQLGRHKNQRVSLFAADFLKQVVTKFLKRKDLAPLQRDYLKPFQQIFLTSKSFAVRQLMIGSLSYFVSNHHSCLRTGWKVILGVVSSCFEQQQDKVIKQKAFAILRKIYQSNFSIFNLEDNYNDLLQILGKLTREKDQSYPLGCLHILQLLVQYYRVKMGLKPEEDEEQQQTTTKDTEVDIHFWQTVFLPLLSILFPMCGDSRGKVQSSAIRELFEILMRYGRLFKYQFWKMVLQGVLRPAFEQITYTSQSKPLKKEQLQKWLKYSFSQLFKSINELIVLYYSHFRLFLEDVFKIYENCILNHSLMLLIELSLKALGHLLDKIAPLFQPSDWQTYLAFVQSLLRKTLPIELSSLDAWSRSKDLLQNNHEAKCYALQTFLNRLQPIFQKYPDSLTEHLYLSLLAELEPVYNFVVEFNANLELREALWKDGFCREQKFLPGLIRHQYQILAFRSKIYFRLLDFGPQYLPQYFQHALANMQALKSSVFGKAIKQPLIADYERERMGMYYCKLVNEIILSQLKVIGANKIAEAGLTQQILQMSLSLMSKRVYCTRCAFCQGCEATTDSWQSINKQLTEIVMMLFPS